MSQECDDILSITIPWTFSGMCAMIFAEPLMQTAYDLMRSVAIVDAPKTSLEKQIKRARTRLCEKIGREDETLVFLSRLIDRVWTCKRYLAHIQRMREGRPAEYTKFLLCMAPISEVATAALARHPRCVVCDKPRGDYKPERGGKLHGGIPVCSRKCVEDPMVNWILCFCIWRRFVREALQRGEGQQAGNVPNGIERFVRITSTGRCGGTGCRATYFSARRLYPCVCNTVWFCSRECQRSGTTRDGRHLGGETCTWDGGALQQEHGTEMYDKRDRKFKAAFGDNVVDRFLSTTAVDDDNPDVNVLNLYVFCVVLRDMLVKGKEEYSKWMGTLSELLEISHST